jgi:DNA polymerase III subunit beta
MSTKKNGAPAPKAKPFNIQCDRDDLVQALNLVGQAIERRSTIPVISHVFLRVEGTKLQVVGTDLDVWVRHTIKLQSSQMHGKVNTFTLPWYGLGKSLSLLLPILTIKVEPKELRAHIVSDGTTLSLDTLPAEDFPAERPAVKSPTKYTIKTDDLARIINNVGHAISPDPSRYYLGGALFQCERKDMLRMVTTDGHRLVVDEVKAYSLTKEAVPIIVPGKTLRIVQRHCKAFPGAVIITSGLDGITFDFGDQVVNSKRIDGSFPDYTRVVPTQNDKFAIINANALDEVLARCPPRERGEKNHAVKLSFKKDMLRVSSVGMAASVSCEYDGKEPLEIGFNPGYLRDALSILGENVGIAFNDAGTPALMMSGEFPQITIMPMMVSKSCG